MRTAGSPADGPAAGAGSGRARRRRWYLVGHLIIAAWLVAALAVSLTRPVVPHAHWLLVHALLLGAASTAILIWSEHFALALLPRADDVGGRRRMARLGAFTTGAVLVTAGIAVPSWAAVDVGSVLVAAAAGSLALEMVRLLRAAVAARFAFILRYYLAATALLPVGVGLGVGLAHRKVDDDLAVRLRLAHEAVNVLGWVGLTVIGTLGVIWPMMVRARLADNAERAGRRAVPWLVTGTILAAVAALVAPPWGGLIGLACYGTGVALSAPPLIDVARRRPPSGTASWSVLAGSCWLVIVLLGLVVVLASSRGFVDVDERLDVLTPPVTVGWILQTLLGALAYLVPMLIGGGPSSVRAMNATVDRLGRVRVAAVNAGLGLTVLPLPTPVRRLGGILLIAALTSHVLLVARAALIGRALRRSR